jgi:hypothetical protein
MATAVGDEGAGAVRVRVIVPLALISVSFPPADPLLTTPREGADADEIFRPESVPFPERA